MNPLLMKEVRLIAPAWIAALLLVVGGCLVAHYDNGANTYQFLGLGIGAVLLGLSTFGQEFNHGTFSLLLAQPLERRKTWRIKMGVGAMAQISILLLLCGLIFALTKETNGGFGVLRQYLRWGCLVIVTLWTGTLWATLLLKQVAAAFWVAVCVPLCLLYLTVFLSSSDTVRVMFPALEQYMPKAVSALFVVYSLFSFWFARKLFFSTQDTQWSGGSIGVPALGRALLTKVVPPTGVLATLIHKELQLHIVSMGGAVVLTMLHLLLQSVHALFPKMPGFEVAELLLLICWLTIPLLIGTSAVAEERKLNTLEGQLCLTASKRAQFLVKFVVALVLGGFLGAVLPAVMMSNGILGPSRDPRGLGFLLLVSTVITMVSFYASTLTKGILQASATAVGVVIAAYGLFCWLGVRSKNPFVFYYYGCIALIVFLVVLLWLAYSNFGVLRVDKSVIGKSVLRFLSAAAVFFVVTYGVYYRVWESVIRCEPDHGAPRLKAGDRIKVISNPKMYSILALLPDGRLWVGNEFETKMEYRGRPGEKMIGGMGFDVVESKPTKGSFLDSSNWADVASGVNKVYGIRTDGTLWSIEFRPSNPLEGDLNTIKLSSPKFAQVGTDTDWKSISGHLGHWLAVKKDGTLWGWGWNYNGQLGALTNNVSSPIQMDTRSDWLTAFAQERSSIAVKKDGSIWRWGNLPGTRRASQQGGEKTRRDPIRLAINGTNWVELNEDRFDHYLIGIQPDNQVFRLGYLSRNYNDSQQDSSRSAPKPMEQSEWRKWSSDASIGKDGTLWMNLGISDECRRWSQYKDWVALARGPECVALAADGTLCAWRFENYSDRTKLSHRPVWSLNIFN